MGFVGGAYDGNPATGYPGGPLSGNAVAAPGSSNPNVSSNAFVNQGGGTVPSVVSSGQTAIPGISPAVMAALTGHQIGNAGLGPWPGPGFYQGGGAANMTPSGYNFSHPVTGGGGGQRSNTPGYGLGFGQPSWPGFNSGLNLGVEPGPEAVPYGLAGSGTGATLHPPVDDNPDYAKYAAGGGLDAPPTVAPDAASAADPNFYDPLSGLPMPPVTQQSRGIPDWLSNIFPDTPSNVQNAGPRLYEQGAGAPGQYAPQPEPPTPSITPPSEVQGAGPRQYQQGAGSPGQYAPTDITVPGTMLPEITVTPDAPSQPDYGTLGFNPPDYGAPPPAPAPIDSAIAGASVYSGNATPAELPPVPAGFGPQTAEVVPATSQDQTAADILQDKIQDTPAGELIDKYGNTPTLRQIVAGESPKDLQQLIDNFPQNIDFKIDLTKPLEPQLSETLSRGNMGVYSKIAVPQMMAGFFPAGGQLSEAGIRSAASSGNQDIPATPPTLSSGAAIGPAPTPPADIPQTNWLTPQIESPPQPQDMGQTFNDALGGVPQPLGIDISGGYGGGSPNEQLTHLALSDPTLAAMRADDLAQMSTPEGQAWARKNIAGFVPQEVPYGSGRDPGGAGFNSKNVTTWFNAQENRGTGLGLDPEEVYQNLVPDYKGSGVWNPTGTQGSFWPGPGTAGPGTKNPGVGGAPDPETGVSQSYYNNAGTTDPILQAQIMGAYMDSLSGSPLGGLINNSGANAASMVGAGSAGAINMAPPNTINYPKSMFGEDYAASPQQGVYNLIDQYNAAQPLTAQGGAAPLTATQIQNILMNEGRATPQQFTDEGPMAPDANLAPDTNLYDPMSGLPMPRAPEPIDPGVGNVFSNTNWQKFEAGARPSTNVEDLRNPGASIAFQQQGIMNRLESTANKVKQEFTDTGQADISYDPAQGYGGGDTSSTPPLDVWNIPDNSSAGGMPAQPQAGMAQYLSGPTQQAQPVTQAAPHPVQQADQPAPQAAAPYQVAAQPSVGGSNSGPGLLSSIENFFSSGASGIESAISGLGSAAKAEFSKLESEVAPILSSLGSDVGSGFSHLSADAKAELSQMEDFLQRYGLLPQAGLLPLGVQPTSIRTAGSYADQAH